MLHLLGYVETGLAFLQLVGRRQFLIEARATSKATAVFDAATERHLLVLTVHLFALRARQFQRRTRR